MGWMLLLWLAIGTVAMAVVGVARSLRSRRMQRLANETDPVEPVGAGRARTGGARPRATKNADSEAPLS